MAKTPVSKTFYLSTAWNGRKYSQSSDVPTFTAPSSLSVTPSGTTNGLSWTNGTASTQTRVYRSTTESGTYSLITTVDAGVSSYDNTGLFAGTYWYKLEHVSANGSTSAQTSAVSGVIASGGATSGGTAAFAWSAPSGVADNNSITITSNSETFVEPNAHIYLGFGMGWLYSQADDTLFPSSVAVGSEYWLHESQNAALVGRTVATVSGQKVLRSVMKVGGASDPDGAGCLNWDSGSALTPDDTLYLFRRTRCTVGTKTGEFQWKQLRIRPGRDLENGTEDPAGNEAYCPRGNVGSGWQRIDVTPGTGSDVGYGTRLPTDGGVWCSFGWVWKPNTQDTADGVMYTHLVDENRSGFARQEPKNSSNQYPRNVIRSTSSNRPRWGMAQDYIQPTAGSADFTIESTDYYFKRNGDLFVLADSDDLSTVTEPPVPLVPTAFNSASSWTFNLWKGGMSTYSGKYIHRLSALLEPLQVVAL